jgi:uncharacterized membrane-anchored protein YhcB (DUF1043 family)
MAQQLFTLTFIAGLVLGLVVGVVIGASIERYAGGKKR